MRKILLVIDMQNDFIDGSLGTNEAVKIVRELIQLQIINDLSSSFFVATELRNDFNHAGFRDNPQTVDKIIKSIGERIQKVYNILIPQSDVH